MGLKNEGIKLVQSEFQESPSFDYNCYDIEVFGIIDDLIKKFPNGSVKTNNEIDNSSFFALLELGIVNFLKSQEIDLSINIKWRHYILPSSSKMYSQYLGWKILTVYTDKIDALLSYQAKHYYKSNEKFCELVDHGVREFVRTNNYFNETTRIEEIKLWLKDNRIPMANDEKEKPPKTDFQSGLSLQETNELSSQLKEWILPDYLNKFVEIEKELYNREYIDQYHQWQKKLTVLVEFVCVIIVYNYFKPIVNGKKIKDFHKRQFISERYGYKKSGLTDTWGKVKPKIDSAKIPFSWIEKPK